MATRAEHETLIMVYLTGQATEVELGDYRRLYATDGEFRSLAQEIEQWLAPLNDDVTDVDPPEGLLDAIMAQIAESDPKPAAAIPVANDRTGSADSGGKVAAWRGAALASMLVALLAIGSHFIAPDDPIATAQSEALMAMLSDPSAPELIAIVYSPEDGRIVARFSNIDVPEGNTLQLWLIREGEDGPRSLGVLETVPQSDRVELDIDSVLQPGTDTLAISLEAEGGSTSDAPEGPVLFTGPVWQTTRSSQ